MFIRYFCVALVTAVFVTPGLRLNAQTRAAGIDVQRLASIPVRMRELLNTGTYGGGVMLVAYHGKIVMLDAVGYRDIDTKQQMLTDTIFDIRSITKVVTAIGVMILVEEGRLTLDDPVEIHLPEFKRTGKTPIRVRHLLTHTSGLPLYKLPVSEEIAIKRNQTLEQYVQFLSKQEPEFEPGTQHRYASGGFAILGRVIEVVSGQRFEQFMKERIFEPLGMKDSFFFVPAEKQSRVAAIYRLQENKLARWTEIEAFNRKSIYPAPEFGMYSTATDLFALSQMMLNGGSFNGKRILSRASVIAMTVNQTLGIPTAVTKRPAWQGLGWGVTGDPLEDFPLTSPGSYGHNGAFGSMVWIDPQKDLVRIFLQHRLGPAREIDIFMAMAGAAVVD